MAATIKLARPDLVEKMQGVKGEAEPIPNEPPPDYFKEHIDYIEDIGEPMNPCFFVNTDIDPTNWFVFLSLFFFFPSLFIFFAFLLPYSFSFFRFNSNLNG